MSARIKSVYVTGYPNIAPAGIAITMKGEGTNLPMKLVVTGRSGR